MAKAHKITVENHEILAVEHGVDAEDLVMFVGSYLVTGFGGHPVNGFVSELNIKKFFNITEINCDLGYYGIEKKESVLS